MKKKTHNALGIKCICTLSRKVTNGKKKKCANGIKRQEIKN